MKEKGKTYIHNKALIWKKRNPLKPKPTNLCGFIKIILDLSEGKGKGTSASNPCGTDSWEMEQESNKKMSDMLWRPWEYLPPELLELIFNYCPLHDKLMIQSVCKSWNKKIDMLEWSKNRDPATLNRMLLSDLTFPLSTASAENLTTLKIPWSVISNEMVIQEATKLSNLPFLDLSYCRHIGGHNASAQVARAALFKFQQSIVCVKDPISLH
ncbi:F-box domain containing protein [Parasponia andersonii]|uniref:F-box domain containing protein n=1 Tax=Parasponia andersonii TaxID=3476 RepID=A0A2P5A8X4_PARAD|nr:F-box domain containing protein [Parasponia andersonii]